MEWSEPRSSDHPSDGEGSEAVRGCVEIRRAASLRAADLLAWLLWGLIIFFVVISFDPHQANRVTTPYFELSGTFGSDGVGELEVVK
jgi:hypothetical protein